MISESATAPVSAGLPVLDLSRLDRGEAEAERFRTDLREATHEYGFFYLTGHGVPADLVERVMRTARAFFDLTEADKMAIENLQSPQFRGYTRVGGELTQGTVGWREQIDIGPERPRTTGGADYLRLEGPNQWPAALPELREVATDGYLKATVHRVISPLVGDDRISIPFFFGPALDATIPLLALPESLEAPGITVDPENPIFTTYGENALKSRLRAHPDVAASHHADLLGDA